MSDEPEPTYREWKARLRHWARVRADAERRARPVVAQFPDVEEIQRREDERRLVRKLAHQVIDDGFKVRARALHPDKGGSTEAMARLNRVRAMLKRAV
jgi:hypothetical protein